MISLVRDVGVMGERVAVISQALLGLPYRAYPLTGSVHEPERLVVSLDGFDCVTYMESVLALAGSRNASEFPDRLRRLRYCGGIVGWRERNHYMVDWIRNNSRDGSIRRLALGRGGRRLRRTLAAIEGLPRRDVVVSCLPKQRMGSLSRMIAGGDLVFFVSTKRSLDVFHTGILVRDRDDLVLRHASRSRGRVVEEALEAFLRANRMSGVIVVRPVG